MVVMTKATVWYACYLDEEQEKMVKDYAKEHDVTLEEAVNYLYSSTDVDFELYKDSHESDFMTNEIESVEED